MKRYKYRLYSNNKFIGIYSASKIEKVLGIPRRDVILFAENNLIYINRYRFERDDSYYMKFKKEWNECRFMILNSGNKCKA